MTDNNPTYLYGPPARAALLMAAGVILLTLLRLGIEAQPKSSGNIDWIFVIDTSKSMRGVGPGAQNVFEEVKEQIKQFIHTANDNDTIAIYTFDEKTTLTKSVMIRNSFDRMELLQGVDELRPEGRWTYTGNAVSTALNRAEVIQSKYNDTNREVAIVLFTDDKEDHDPNHPSRFLRDIPVLKTNYRPFTFLVYLNRNPVPQDLKDFISQFGSRGSITKYSSPEEISDLKTKVLAVLEPSVVISPLALSFGELEPGSTSETQSIRIQTTKPVILTAALEDKGTRGISLIEPSGPVTLKETDNQVTFRVKIDRDQPNTDYAGAIILKIATPGSAAGQGGDAAQSPPLGDHKITFGLFVTRVSLFKKALKWSPWVLSGLITLYVLTYIVIGGHPHIIFGRDAWLEGQLIIRRPRSEGLNNTINLAQQQKRRVKLSDLQGGILKPYLDDADAELQTVRNGGGKLVAIKRTEGNLFVQSEKVIESNLKDGEIIEIGDLALEFRGYQSNAARSATGM